MLQVSIRHLETGDEEAVYAASFLFDKEPQPAATLRFLADPTHHLLVAYDARNEPVGFVSGIQLTHPDLGTEMFLYQLGVDDRARRQGVGGSLVEALKALAKERHCYGMWVLTEADNVAAHKIYARDESKSSAARAFEWFFPPAPGDETSAE